ncbi:MAG TPA: flagellar basal body L-ring protein FlgH [Steroidobacteraceae bacterium]|jgi:flagellar L-ring protein precursor FlgH|nr:flagellar basal body L-ring protein FlgH [Steroidobacteraceae bacterium]
MRHPTFFIACLCATALLAGCGTLHPAKKEKKDDDDGLSWLQEPVPPASNGAIYQVGRDVALFENPIARHIGDVVTIVLSEATAAQKSATTSTSKATSDTMPGVSLFGSPVTIHGASVLSGTVNDASKFDGAGNSAQSNSLTGFITATVAKVLPNGNLYVKGEKKIWINQGQENVMLSGVIRAIDVAPDNSVPSSRVANARITYGGKGAIADANAAGWLSRFFNSPWTPF